MAHFYGTVQGSAKTLANRRGTKATGISVAARSWDGSVTVGLEEHDGITYARIGIDPASSLSSRSVLWYGKLSDLVAAGGVNSFKL